MHTKVSVSPHTFVTRPCSATMDAPSSVAGTPAMCTYVHIVPCI